MREFTLNRIFLLLIFIATNAFSTPYLSWDAFDDISSSIKKATVLQAKNQSIRLDTTHSDISNLSEYELDIYNYILEIDTAKTPVFSIMSGIDWQDTITYQLFGDFSYSNKYWEAELGYQVDSRFGADSLYNTGIGKRDREVFARVYNASFMLKFFKNWQFGFNRKPFNYSYIGNQSTFLSNNPYSFDKLELKYKGEMFQFDIFSGLISDDSKDGKKYYRRVYGKHLNFIFNVGDFIIAPGLMESMVDANTSDVFRFNYLYPIMPSFLNMMNTEAGGNAFIAVDLLLKYSKYANYYIQFGVDDFQVDRGSGNPGDEEPNMWTLTTEANYYPTKNIGLELSYTKVQPWVYYVNYNTTEKYQHFGKSLGYDQNNSDKFRFSVYHDWKKIRNRIEVSYNRYGWQSLNDDAFYGVYWEDYDLSKFPVCKKGEIDVTKVLDLRYTFRYARWGALTLGYINRIHETNNGSDSKNEFLLNIAIFPQIKYQIPFDFLK